MCAYAIKKKKIKKKQEIKRNYKIESKRKGK